jgi:hypothetical protein
MKLAMSVLFSVLMINPRIGNVAKPKCEIACPMGS